MKKAENQSTNAIPDAAERLARGVERGAKEGREDKQERDSNKSTKTSDDGRVVVRQRRRPRGPKK